MKVHTDLTTLPEFQNAVVTIGTFDGVHLGHRQILNQLKEEAKKINGETVLITFYPHPRLIIGSKTQLQLINTPQEKQELLAEQGVAHLVIVPFTQDFANQTAEDYCDNFLIKYFHPHTLIIGYDHRFGQGRKGDFHLLEQYASNHKFQLIEIPQHLLHESAISSTRIRENLLSGNLQEANELLGYDYFFEGLVVEGNKIGRTIGYPTANLQIEDSEKLVPANGVYAVSAQINNSGHPMIKGMMNIGVRPTVNGTKRTIEVNLLDFEKDIYGQTLKVYLKKYLRGEQKFSGLDALKEQLAKDKKAVEDLKFKSSGNL